MTIGIITIMDVGNYGNRLQNYAVYHILKNKFDCRAVTLSAVAEKCFQNGNYLGWTKEHIAQALCCFPSFAEKRFGPGITRMANFRKWNRNIPIHTFYNTSQLPAALNKQYDAFLAGSDQIWNYHFSSNRFHNFFLQFASPEKRNAICGSFGVDDIPDEWKQTFIDGLNGFSHLSVREDAGAQIVRELTGREVPVLIDPVMMLSPEEWNSVSCKPRVDIHKPYVLKYYLGDSEQSKKIDAWAKKNGYEVYELLNQNIPELYSAGPGEFISLIRNASLVCSDSFHCIAFSIIFSRPFVVFSRVGGSHSMTSRLHTLLGKFGFQNRWDSVLQENQYLGCDYSSVPAIMAQEQKKFMDYLFEVIK